MVKFGKENSNIAFAANISTKSQKIPLLVKKTMTTWLSNIDKSTTAI
jgi:hypothetical protein